VSIAGPVAAAERVIATSAPIMSLGCPPDSESLKSSVRIIAEFQKAAMSIAAPFADPITAPASPAGVAGYARATCAPIPLRPPIAQPSVSTRISRQRSSTSAGGVASRTLMAKSTIDPSVASTRLSSSGGITAPNIRQVRSSAELSIRAPSMPRAAFSSGLVVRRRPAELQGFA
jgi:hypothetical protein